jgi:hypothetical protein
MQTIVHMDSQLPKPCMGAPCTFTNREAYHVPWHTNWFRDPRGILGIQITCLSQSCVKHANTSVSIDRDNG